MIGAFGWNLRDGGRGVAPSDAVGVRVARLAGALALAALLAAPGSGLAAAAEDGPPEIPFPDLGRLEPAVAEQLGDMQELLREGLARPEATPAERAELYGELGRLYHAYDLPEAARAAYLAASERAPADFRWTYLRAYLEQQTGRLAEADGLYRRALKLRPDSFTSRVHAAEVALADNRIDDAERLFREALARGPGEPSVLAGLGQVALSRRQFEEAVELLGQALAAVPEATRLHHPLGLAYRGLGNLERARHHLSQRGAVGVRPPDPLVDELRELTRGEAVHLLRGRSAFRAGRFSEAAAEFRSAVEAAPESVAARVNLGTALARSGDSEGAVREFESAIALDPMNGTARFNLGTLLVRRGDLEGGIPHLRSAVEVSPADGIARLELAESLHRIGRDEEAYAHYVEAVAAAPRSERARLGEAEMLVRAEQFAEARRRLETAHGLLPESGLLAHGLARLLAASPDPAVRDGERALDLARRVYAARPTARHAETVALALAETGRCGEAAEWQRRALDATAAAVAALEATLERYRSGEPCRPPLREPASPAGG